MEPPRNRERTEYLVLLARSGDSAAFRRLVAEWQEPLWRQAYRLCGREDGAWDILQESWLAIADGIGELRDPSRFAGWTYTIVARRAADWQRRNPDATPIDASALTAPEEEKPSDALALLRRGLRRLSAERRELLTLRYVDDLELSEIAEIQKVPEGTVKSRLYHARKELRLVIERLEL